MNPEKKHFSSIIIYVFIFLLVVFFSLHLAIAYDWAVKNPTVNTLYDGSTQERFNVAGFFNMFEKSMTETPFRFSWNQYSGMILAFSCGLTLIIFLHLFTNKGKYMRGKEHGSAVWGKLKELASLRYKAVKKMLVKQAKTSVKEYKLALKKDKSLNAIERKALIEDKKAKTEQKIEKIKKENDKHSEIILANKISFSIYGYELNCNVLVYGGSGSGKTRGIVMPNVLTLAGKCSFVITDPKGEIYTKAKYFLKKMGYKVRCLNLFEKSKTSHYNPLHYIHVDRKDYDWQEDVLILIDTIILNCDGGEGRKSPDPFWEDTPRHLMQAIMFFMMYMLDKEDRNMNSFMDLLGMLEIAEEEDNFDCPLDIAFQMLGEKFGKDNIAYRTYKDFRTKAKGKTAASIVMTIVSKLQPYNIVSIQAMSDKDELELDKIGEELTALFIIVPPTSKTFNFVAGEVFTQGFQEINYCANALHGGRLPVPVQFIMDEFANTCIVPNFPQIISYARSLGVGIMPILQAREQLKGMYEKDWVTIEGQCDSTVVLGKIKSTETLKTISEDWLGTGTYVDEDYSETKGQSSSTSKQHKKYGRVLMTKDEVKNMPLSDCLVFISGRNPFYCKKYKYKRHENYKYTSDFDGRLPKIYDEEEQREKEASQKSLTLREDEGIKTKVNDVLKEADNAIKIDKDPASVMQYMESQYIGAWNFVNDDMFIVDEGEEDEVLFDAELEEEISKHNEETKDIINSIADFYEKLEREKIEVTAEPTEVLETLEQWSENMESVSFVNDEQMIVDEGEPDEELYEDDSEELAKFNDLLNNARSLEAELGEVANLQNGNGLSMEELFGTNETDDDSEEEDEEQ